MEEIVNRVSKSKLVTIDLEDYLQDSAEVVGIDISDQLHMGIVLKESEFREFIKEKDWGQYKGKAVAIYCSTDAIIPTWTYMLLAIALSPYAVKVFFGREEKLREALLEEAIDAIRVEEYRDAKVVIKGCSVQAVPVSAYVKLTEKLTPVVKSIMYGEPCSTVPLYKAGK